MENLSPMKMSPMKASPMKTSPIKNVSNNGRLINKRRMVRDYDERKCRIPRRIFERQQQINNIQTQQNQSNKPANKRIRLEFSRNNLRVRFYFQLTHLLSPPQRKQSYNDRRKEKNKTSSTDEIRNTKLKITIMS